MIKFLLAILLTLAPCFGQGMILNPYRFSSPSSYLIHEDCEGTGTPTGWVNTGSPNWDYTSSPVAGSQSLQLPFASNVKYEHGAVAEIWYYFQIKIGGLNSNSDIFDIQDAGGGTIGYVLSQAADGQFKLVIGSAAASTTGSLAADTTYHFWIHIKNNGGTSTTGEIFISANGTRPSSGSLYATVTTSSVTAQPAKMYLDHANAAMTNVRFDNIIVSTSEIGDNPF